MIRLFFALFSLIVFSSVKAEQLYPNNLKNWEFGKEAPQNFDSERATIAERQGASENQNCELQPTRPKTDSSGYFGITMVIPSYNNEKWASSNLDSVLHQNYFHYRILYVNDCSSDQTRACVETLLEQAGVDYRIVEFEECGSIEETTVAFAQLVNAESHFFTLIHNRTRAGALANLYRMIHSCANEEIVVTVDGDDWLAHNNVLSLVNETYLSGEIWFTHGTVKEYPWGHVAWSEPVPPHFIETNAFRAFKCPSHLRTFYAWLFKKIRLEDFLYEGVFYPMTWDMAIMYPLGEMAGFRHAFIQEPIYIYNMQNAINDNKINADLQNVLDAYIRKQPRYERLP